METSLSLGNQQIRFDRDATLALYQSTVTKSGADSCACTYCRNFAEQREVIFTDEFKALLDCLGIDYQKEWEVFELGATATDPLTIRYGGWFLFCGELTEGPDEHPERPFSFCFSTRFPNATLPHDRSFCVVEFTAAVRWILSEPYE
jgi:hypothetical protein